MIIFNRVKYHVEPLRSPEEIEEIKIAIKRGYKGMLKCSEFAACDDLNLFNWEITSLRVSDLVCVYK